MVVVDGKAQAFLTAVTDRATTFLFLEENVVLGDRHLVTGPEGDSSTDLSHVDSGANSTEIASGGPFEVSSSYRTPSPMSSTNSAKNGVLFGWQSAGIVWVGNGALDPSTFTGSISMFGRPETLLVPIGATAASECCTSVSLSNLTGRAVAAG